MSFSKKTILVADSNKTYVLYMGIILKRMGFNVVPADTGLEAIKLMKMVTPDMLVMDSCQPSDEGIETLKQIRSNPQTKDVPVIIMMAQESSMFASRCAAAGCNGFLPKPVPMDLLHDHIQDFIFSPLGFRRKNLRVQADIKLVVTHENAYREYHTETVSEGGAYLKTDKPLKVGTKLGVTIMLKTGELNLKGTVIYIKTTSDDQTSIPAGMAIEYSGLTAKDMMLLNRLVSELIAGDITDISGNKVLTMPWHNKASRCFLSEEEA